MSTATTPGMPEAVLASIDLIVACGVRRADEIGVGLAGPVDVVGVMAFAGDEAVVFLAAHRGADPGRAHGSVLRQFFLFDDAIP